MFRGLDLTLDPRFWIAHAEILPKKKKKKKRKGGGVILKLVKIAV
jgi:hypothetical protein